MPIDCSASVQRAVNASIGPIIDAEVIETGDPDYGCYEDTIWTISADCMFP